MAANGNFSIIAPDLGRIFLFMGSISCLPFLVTLAFGELDLLLPMASAPLGFAAVGASLVSVPRRDGEAQLSAALASVALIWLVAALIGALPFTFGNGMPYTDSVFEAMSGWTSTGLSLIPSVDDTPKTLLFWRSLTQWLGGIGIVAFTIAMASRSGLTQFRLYRSEGRIEAFMPSVVSTASQMWRIYLIVTFASIGLILLSGVSVWDAVNIAMTAIATGGFSIHSAGIMYYQNPLLEMLVIPIMIAGAMPFKIYYLMYIRRQLRLFRDPQAYLLLALIVIGCAVVTWDLLSLTDLDPPTALRRGAFMVTSGVTCTGFQNADLMEWPGVTVLFLSMLMLIGGSAGSTAGGIKLARVTLAGESLVWWFRRLFVTGRVVVPFRHDGRLVKYDTAELEISKNMLVIVFFILTVFIISIVLLHIEASASYDSNDVIFEVVSAMSNVGLSNGFVNPGMSVASKWLFIFAMWFGRLELVPVIMLASVAVRTGRRVRPSRKKRFGMTSTSAKLCALLMVRRRQGHSQIGVFQLQGGPDHAESDEQQDKLDCKEEERNRDERAAVSDKISVVDIDESVENGKLKIHPRLDCVEERYLLEGTGQEYGKEWRDP